MAKKTKAKRTKKAAPPKKQPIEQEVVEVAPQPEPTGLDRVSIALLILAGVIILAAVWIIWRSVASTQNLPSTSSGGQQTIPLEGQANPNQLQSGSLPLQNQAGVLQSGDSSSALQSQQATTPEDVQKLQ